MRNLKRFCSFNELLLMKNHILHSNLLQFDIFEKYTNLLHFSTTILGGVSRGNYETFNLGEYSGDEYDNVMENRCRLRSMVNIEKNQLFLPYQTHGCEILVIDDAFLNLSDEDKKEKLNGVDALITSEKHICIGVTTADCVPILIYDPQNHVLAAIHAGWRGTVAKIVSKVVECMKERFESKPENLIVGIAPSISQPCFEVGEEVVNSFLEVGFTLDDIGVRNQNTGKIHLDLVHANTILLTLSGVFPQNIEQSNLCTYSDANMFFSARRQTIYSGRMVTGGVLQ